MQKTLLFKTLLVVGLTLLIGIPLLMIESTIKQRMFFRDEAVRSIANDSVREQTVIGPVLVQPYTDEYEEQVTTSNDLGKKAETLRRSVRRTMLVFPGELRVNGSIDTERRYRGIHQVLVYSGQHSIAGDFTLPKRDELPRESAHSRITLGQPYIALSIEDVRGIRNIPKINWGGQMIEFEQGTGLAYFKSGLHAPLAALDLSSGAQVKFSFDLGLDGIERQNFVPIAKNNQFALKSNWPHPQFGGRFLPSPKQRRIDASGFSVNWGISSLATNAQAQVNLMESATAAAAGQAAAVPPLELDRFHVAFIEPVNVYSQADRATKYGLLFVALTFAAFFVFEILKQLPIHPIQYLLVGLALVVFFLLLVGLSEHIAFLAAYLLASAACIVLIGFYLSHVLGDWRRGLGFGLGLSLLYGALYGLLNSESNALVMGSLLLFAVLAALMVATRKVDWYQVGKGAAPAPDASPDGAVQAAH
ncbi:cell envelope integrity protein CreD [Janthinobacterium fluminis]|uniref:Cell envelope integrity protein CreD n=1 Tax=Janthinobacterium fluminis TaxID=2987524 RepID=A0ABT5K950_9BURK|nr:cell envelope integrity protein CreD [Janthinobacterium fluminis]MDC8760317.1 cell envelope integrity protein CreD [Janthinobacterium fluminis]